MNLSDKWYRLQIDTVFQNETTKSEVIAVLIENGVDDNDSLVKELKELPMVNKENLIEKLKEIESLELTWDKGIVTFPKDKLVFCNLYLGNQDPIPVVYVGNKRSRLYGLELVDGEVTGRELTSAGHVFALDGLENYNRDHERSTQSRRLERLF